MNKKTLLKISLFSLVLSSCGYLEKWKTPDQSSDSTVSDVSTPKPSDDVFLDTINELETELDAEFYSDNPANLPLDDDSELLDVREQEITKIEETIPEIQIAESNVNPDAGTVKTYKVKKGETLMQIAFKLYGDIGKWKELKTLNTGIKTTAIPTGTAIKYRVPETHFSWSPVGTPYLIKQGDTLGIISNNLYSTPTRWKNIWENNKPLIKNPNVIYAGFTLYTLDGSMAKTIHPNQGYTAADLEERKEEVMTAQQIISAELPAIETIDADTLIDETIQTLSAPQRAMIQQALEDEIDYDELEEVQILE